MKHLLLSSALAFSCAVVPLPSQARMEAAPGNKLESTSRRRERLDKMRKEEARKAEERLAREQREAKERLAQEQREASERLAREQREAAAAANREYYERLERQREEELARKKAQKEQELAAERKKWARIEEDIRKAGLPENWKQQKNLGLVNLNETMKLKAPVVVFLRESEAHRYMLWMRSDAEAAHKYALERAKEDCAFVLPAGSDVVVTLCGMDDEERRVPIDALFHIASTDGIEGWASNLILRQHRTPKKPAGKR